MKWFFNLLISVICLFLHLFVDDAGHFSRSCLIV
nr:MAG TPA: hypothetical protein [Caudoviricetes sp.]